MVTPAQGITLAQWCRVWTDSRRADPSQLTVRMNAFHLRTRILPYLGYLPLTAITPHVLRLHAAVRIDIGIPVGSVAAEMRLLARVLAAAVDAGHLTDNPAIAVHEPVTVPGPRPGDVPDILDPAGGAR
ncbi:hypothetical protein OG216_25825 [Streptomycetaceae bacterium NBC_01309]